MRRKIDPDCDVVVLDVGTHTIKAGWAGEDSPRCVVPAVVVEVTDGPGRQHIAGRGREAQSEAEATARTAARTARTTATPALRVVPCMAPHEVHVGAAAVAYLSSLDDTVRRLQPSHLPSAQPLAAGARPTRWFEAAGPHLRQSAAHLAQGPRHPPVLLAPAARRPTASTSPPCSSSTSTAPPCCPSTAASLVPLQQSGRTTGLRGGRRARAAPPSCPCTKGFVLWAHAILTQRVGGEDCTAKLGSMLRERGQALWVERQRGGAGHEGEAVQGKGQEASSGASNSSKQAGSMQRSASNSPQRLFTPPTAAMTAAIVTEAVAAKPAQPPPLKRTTPLSIAVAAAVQTRMRTLTSCPTVR